MNWSPYNYTLNNPLKFVDPDGREVFMSKSLWNNPKFYRNAIQSDAFKYMTYLFGKGGIFSHINVNFISGTGHTSSEIKAVTRLSVNGKEAAAWSKLQDTPGKMTLPSDIKQNMTTIVIDLDKMDNKTLDHEISHFAYNALKLLQNELSDNEINMWIERSQDINVFSNQHNTTFIFDGDIKNQIKERGHNYETNYQKMSPKEVEGKIILK